jgi:hypothetical protein
MPKTKKASKPSASKTKKKKAAKKAKPQLIDFGLAQPCLSQAEASFIVGGCLPSGNHHNDDTLTQTGLITDNLRAIFRECVFNGVNAAGCSIDRGQIPNGADTTVGAVIVAVFQNSR